MKFSSAQLSVQLNALSIVILWKENTAYEKLRLSSGRWLKYFNAYEKLAWSRDERVKNSRLPPKSARQVIFFGFVFQLAAANIPYNYEKIKRFITFGLWIFRRTFNSDVMKCWHDT